MIRCLSLSALSLILTALNTASAEELRFAKIIADNMVLQSGKPITVWGWGKPESKVTVTLTQNATKGQAAVATARADEKLPGSEANTDYSVTVHYVEKNAPAPIDQSLEVTSDVDGRWSVTFDSAPASFRPTWISATQDDVSIAVENILIGEVWLCAGQSNMGWSNFNRKDREAASADFPGLRYIAWNDSDYKPLPDVRSRINWQECSPESAQRFSAVPYLFGMYLHRYLKVPVGVINVARGGTLGQTWCMRDELDAIDNEIMKTVLADYDAETTAWDNPERLKQIMAEWEQACDDARKEHATKLAAARAEGKKEPRLRLPKKPGDPRQGWSPPAGLFNATVMPIRDLAIKGVLYYQGENNNFMRWTRYESTFPRIPASFRRAFADETLPFGCISQPGWGQFDLDPEVATVAEGYANVRDIQHRALKNDPHADMIATYPTGNSYIHPAEKLPVAEYASLWALAKVYGEPVQHTGNTYREHIAKDGKLYLFFNIDPVVEEQWSHVENNAYWQVLPCPREGNADFRGFIVAGKDRRWYPARGRHMKLDGKWCIELTSDLVDEPVAARYGWANWPTGNMVGRNRLPMPTFRTDDWPLPQGVNYSKEAEQQAKDAINDLKKNAATQALDRKLRQAQVDVPKYESELYKGDLGGHVRSKVARIEAILAELENDRAVSNGLNRDHKDLVQQINALTQQVKELKTATEQLDK